MNDFTRFFTQTSSKTPITLGQNLYSEALSNPELAGWLMSNQQGIYDDDVVRTDGHTISAREGQVNDWYGKSRALDAASAAIAANAPGVAATQAQTDALEDAQQDLFGAAYVAAGNVITAAEGRRLVNLQRNQANTEIATIKTRISNLNTESANANPTRFLKTKLDKLKSNKVKTKAVKKIK